MVLFGEWENWLELRIEKSTEKFHKRGIFCFKKSIDGKVKKKLKKAIINKNLSKLVAVVGLL